MTRLTVEDLLVVPHLGPLLMMDAGIGIPPALADMAADVEHTAEFCWEASSAASALAWLLVRAHTAASDAANAQLGQGMPTDAGRLDGWVTGYRGQSAVYDTLTPSIYRPHVDRRYQQRALGWFTTALKVVTVQSVWGSSADRWPGWDIDDETVAPAAQHYGIASELLDWTFDPRVAFLFATTSTSPQTPSSVLFGNFQFDSERRPNVYLPPTWCERLWVQKGFFQVHPEALFVKPLHPGLVAMFGAEELRERVSVAEYERVTFTADADETRSCAAPMKALLSVRDETLERLVRWSLFVGKANEPPQHWYEWWFEADDARADIRGRGLPDIPQTSTPPSTIDVGLVLTYLAHMSLVETKTDLGFSTVVLAAFRDSLDSQPRTATKLRSLIDGNSDEADGPVVLGPNAETTKWSEELQSQITRARWGLVPPFISLTPAAMHLLISQKHGN